MFIETWIPSIRSNWLIGVEVAIGMRKDGLVSSFSAWEQRGAATNGFCVLRLTRNEDG